ncbi:MAG: hypothetical protein U9N84_08250, partial [Actinomycetota bacterium]|nr:hypothetical protein [Actinomycetota bacterium]
RRRVTITRSLAEVRGAITETEPKTSASKRSITLPQAVVDDLAPHLELPPFLRTRIVRGLRAPWKEI